MKQILFLLLITLCSCHSTTSKKGQENEADSILLQEELYPDSIFKFKPIPTKEEQEQPSETTSFVLQPIPRDILREKLSALLHFPCRQNTIIIHCQLQK